MGALDAGSEILGGAVGVGRHDIPADAPVSEVIQRGELPRQRVRVVICGRGRNSETKMGCGRRHGGNSERGVVGRNLGRVPKGSVNISAVDVVISDVVGEEDAVEAGLFKHAGIVDPVLHGFVLAAAIIGMPPQARGQVGRTREVEREESHLVHFACFLYVQ